MMTFISDHLLNGSWIWNHLIYWRRWNTFYNCTWWNGQKFC